MYLVKSKWSRSFLCAIVLLTSTIGLAMCSDSNSEGFASGHRRIPSSGSGGGGPLETRSSYASLKQAFSETINTEFGSE